MSQESSERERAMLQPVDREYLADRKEYATPQGEYDRQEQIRNRVKGAILDFIPVQESLSDWNWGKFTDLERKEEMRLRSGMVAAMALFYEFHHTMGWDFGATLRDAVDQAHTYGTRRQMPRRIVDDVEFEAKTREPEKFREIQDRIKEKMEKGEELTHHEKSVAVDLGGPLLQQVHNYTSERGKRKRREKAFESVQEDIERHGHPDDR